MSFEIGERLKAVRMARGLSQRELAKRSGVANATISQIESNRLNPTVGALKRILDGIPISLGAFFEMELESEEQIFFSADDLVELGDGQVSFRQIGMNLQGKAIQFLHEKYQPGASTGKIALSHDGEEHEHGGAVFPLVLLSWCEHVLSPTG